MKKVFLEELPRKIYKGRECIDWINSIGCKVEFIYDDINEEIEIIEYKKKNQIITIKYNYNLYKIKTSHFCRCEIGKIIGKRTSNFRFETEEIFKDDKRDLTIIGRKIIKDKKGKQLKYYKYKCNKCGFDGGRHWSNKDKCYKDEFWICEYDLLKGIGCACCSNYPKIVVKGINDITTTNPELVKYFVDIEDAYTHTYSSADKVYFKCLECGSIKKYRIDSIFFQGFSCSRCGDGISYPNKFMYKLLEQLNIEFKTEYSPEWIKPRRYDFYIPEKQLIIEMDGAFHSNDNYLNGQTAKESKEIDNCKDKLAKEHGLIVVRIDSFYGYKNRFKYIKNNILNSRLKEIFDLNEVDWVEIGKDSEKSLVKEVCDYWHLHNDINNEGLSTKDICDIFKLGKSCVIKYLKIGNCFNWCKYNPKKEIIKAVSKNGKNCSKQIEVFKEEKSLGIFPSGKYISENSLNLFGVKLLRSNISLSCTGKIKEYKGFVFKHI